MVEMHWNNPLTAANQRNPPSHRYRWGSLSHRYNASAAPGRVSIERRSMRSERGLPDRVSFSAVKLTSIVATTVLVAGTAFLVNTLRAEDAADARQRMVDLGNSTRPQRRCISP